MRVLAAELSQHRNRSVELAGWLHKIRKLGGITFILVRDRSGLAQVKVEETAQASKLRGLQIGTIMTVKGKVAIDKRAPAGLEIHQPKLEILVPVAETPPIEIDKPIDHQAEHLDTLFENRVYNLRNLDEGKIFKIRAALVEALRQFLRAQDFTEVQTPKLLAGATEGGAEVFELEYFGAQATLAQSPQLYKQILVGAFERLFEIGPAFRAEPSMTTRHMSEMTMLDIEMGFIANHEEVLQLSEQLFYEVLHQVYKSHQAELKALGAPPLKLSKSLPRFSVAEVHELYSKATKQDTRGQKDLLPAEERWICAHALKKNGSEAVLVRDFPIEAMKFYHMVNPDNPKTVLWADLLFRGIEIATIPQREHRYEQLVKQIKAAGLDPKHPAYRYYLQAFQAGLPPHGGFGFGIDRLVQTVIGLNNVKEATLFPRDMNRLSP